MEIYLYNTLKKRKEKFKAVKSKKVNIYNCGPTVYDRQHIGNMRAAVVWDILRRTLEFAGFKVKQVVNITDFGHLTSDADEGEDKMLRGLKRENLPLTLKAMRTLADKYAELYFDDKKKLNIVNPSYSPFASDSIKEDILLIKELKKKGYAYKILDGIYFDTLKYPNYGKLGGISKEIKTRIGINSLKRNPEDFALWKFSKKNEVGWDSPWGKGFPGWHTECSAIILKHFTNYLKTPKFHNDHKTISDGPAIIDVHTGGIEHISIHHNNEIAQSESATGRPLADYWLHNEHLIMRDGKMAKSLGNIVTLKEIEERGLNPLSLRLLFLQAHYRSPIMFSWEALEGTDTALSKIKSILTENTTIKKGRLLPKYIKEFKKIIGEDLDTPKAVALLWEVLKDKKLNIQDKVATVLEFDKVLGLNLANAKKEKKSLIPSQVQKLADKREEARENNNWQEADRIRDLIKKEGFEIKDTKKGHSVTPIS